MFLREPPESTERKALYSTGLAGEGYVMNLTRLWAWRPDVFEAFAGARTLLLEKSTLSARERAALVCATVGGLGDSYCSLAWGTKLAKEADASIAAAVLRGEAAAGMTPREIALTRWAGKVVRDPNATAPSEIETLRAAGCSDREIFEATVLIAFRLAFSTVNDALGAAPDRQLIEGAPSAVLDAVDFGRSPARRPA